MAPSRRVSRVNLGEKDTPKKTKFHQIDRESVSVIQGGVISSDEDKKSYSDRLSQIKDSFIEDQTNFERASVLYF